MTYLSNILYTIYCKVVIQKQGGITMLTKEREFTFDTTKKIGHVRAEFGFKGLIAQQFVRTTEKAIYEVIEDAHKVDDVNDLILKEVQNLDVLIDYFAEGQEGYEKSFNWYYSDDNANYWVRIIPVIHDYNCYISIYHK